MPRTKEEIREYAKEYARKRRASDPAFLERCREQGRKSREKRREVALKECAEWKAANKEKIAEYNRFYSINRYKTDPIFKLKHSQRNRIRSALKRNWKRAKTESLLGCSYEQLKAYIEQKFIDGMSWDNMGQWHIDHVIPISSFDLSCEEAQRQAFSYKNLQPLWAKDNLLKGSKRA